MHLASYMYEPIVEDFITLNLSIYIIHSNNLTLTGVRKEHILPIWVEGLDKNNR